MEGAVQAREVVCERESEEEEEAGQREILWVEVLALCGVPSCCLGRHSSWQPCVGETSSSTLAC